MENQEQYGMQVVQPQAQGAVMTVKALTDRVNMVHEVLKRVMKEDTHFGKVPGCGKKQVLLKPGADLLATMFRLCPQFKVERTDLQDGHREYDVTCSMYGPDGNLLGQGVGSGSTMEKKYRYRWEGNNRVENEDIADVYNTVLKMAKKRAHIDATLTVTGAADIFTQDLIDDEDVEKKQPVKMPTAKAKPAPAQDDAPPREAPADADMLMLDLGKVNSKKADNGGTRWYFKHGEDWYSTFDTKLGAALESLQNQAVEVLHVAGKTGRTIVGVKAAEGDNLPM